MKESVPNVNLPASHKGKYGEPKSFMRIPLKMHYPQSKAGGLVPYNYSQVSMLKSQPKLSKTADVPFHKPSVDASAQESKHSDDEEDRVSQQTLIADERESNAAERDTRPAGNESRSRSPSLSLGGNAALGSAKTSAKSSMKGSQWGSSKAASAAKDQTSREWQAKKADYPQESRQKLALSVEKTSAGV